jgi:hypothetical protein
MCDGEGLGLIQMAMTPIGLAVVAGIAVESRLLPWQCGCLDAG